MQLSRFEKQKKLTISLYYNNQKHTDNGFFISPALFIDTIAPGGAADMVYNHRHILCWIAILCHVSVLQRDTTLWPVNPKGLLPNYEINDKYMKMILRAMSEIVVDGRI